jgi:protein subunit release factor A
MGMYLVSALDAMYEANSTVERPAKRFEQLPLIKRFAIDPEARGSVTSFFELKDQVDTAVKTANMLERGDPEVYDKYIEDNQNLLASKDYINALASDMKDLAKMKVMIRASDDSAEVKKDALLEIQQLENDMTENMQELKREFTP